MYELIPILAGVVAGAVAIRIESTSLRAALIAAVALAAALAAGVASGELQESWAFLLWDAVQAVAAALLVLVALPRLARRAG
jgi:hypothetical protein